MRILIDARLYGLENTGIGRYTMNLIENLSQIDKANSYFILLKKKYFDELRLPINFQKVLADFNHYSFIEQVRLPFLISSLKPDISHFVHFNVPIFFGGNYVVTIHDLLMHKQKGFSATTLSKGMYLIKRLGYSLAFSTAVKKSKALIVPSKFVKARILSDYKVKEDKVVVTYEGVSFLPHSRTDVLKKYDLEGKKYFIYTGNAYPHKNLERAIEAIKLLNENANERVIFCIVSARDHFSKKLEMFVKKKGIEDLVKILGFVPDNELSSLYKGSVAFVYPTLSEGFGLPGLEAMLSGTLVTASEIEVLKEIYEDSVTYFNPLNLESIERSMKNVLELTQQQKKEKVTYGKKFAKRYSWEKMAVETLKVYKKLYNIL